jgi:gelsolin
MVVTGDIDGADDGRPERISWKESNLAAIGSDLDHKIKQAAAGKEEAWHRAVGATGAPGLWVWRVEDFAVVPWPEEDYGCFYSGDSYLVLHGWVEPDTEKVRYDVYIWIGSASSQDEYGTAAYKMVEADDFVGGTAIQHREVEGKESAAFIKLFVKDGDGEGKASALTYWQGGVASGFRHVEPTEEKPILFRIKGSSIQTMSLKQLPVKKSSLTSGDSFVLKVSDDKVWLWNGQSVSISLRSQGQGENEFSKFLQMPFKSINVASHICDSFPFQIPTQRSSNVPPLLLAAPSVAGQSAGKSPSCGTSGSPMYEGDSRGPRSRKWR